MEAISKNDVDIFNAAFYVVIFDIVAAILSMLIIIPAVFSFSMQPAAGPPLCLWLCLKFLNKFHLDLF